MKQRKIGFVGFGHMAQVLFEAFDRAKILPRSSYLFTRKDSSKKKEAEEKYKITSAGLKHLVSESDVLFLCVRPHQMKEAMDQIREYSDLKEKLLISILAGVKIESIQKKAPGASVIRVMPNLASAVGEGMSTLTYSKECNREDKEFARTLFAATGKIVELDESQTDIACAMAGSGPGFVFKLIDAVAKEGQKSGISKENATLMVAQTFKGAAELILKGDSVEDLILRIAVPNGTTQAGFDKMKELGIENALKEVILASAKRSKELSSD